MARELAERAQLGEPPLDRLREGFGEFHRMLLGEASPRLFETFWNGELAEPSEPSGHPKRVKSERSTIVPIAFRAAGELRAGGKSVLGAVVTASYVGSIVGPLAVGGAGYRWRVQAAYARRT